MKKRLFPPFILYYIISAERVERSVKSKITLEGRYLCHSVNSALYILNSISGTFPGPSKVSYCDLLCPCMIKGKGSHVKMIQFNWLWIHLVAFRAAVKDHGLWTPSWHGPSALLQLPAVPQKGAYTLVWSPNFCSCCPGDTSRSFGLEASRVYHYGPTGLYIFAYFKTYLPISLKQGAV